MQIRSHSIREYREAELKDGDQVVGFKHIGNDSWSVLTAPMSALEFLKATGGVPKIEPGEPDKPTPAGAPYS